MPLSITETPNEITKDIDIADSLQIIELLEKTDSEIFNGYEDFPGISSPEILGKLEDCIQKTAELLRSQEKKVILFSGAGTSGRLAMFVSRTFNQQLLNPKEKSGGLPDVKIFHYLIAGGDVALIAAQEGAEDDPIKAVDDLKNIIGDAKNVGYFGITCGLSAPYVAGQLDYMVKQLSEKKLNGFACLVGFNPADRARNVPIEKWDKTFYQVVEECQKSPDFVLINPVVGPEPITGSTRMKSGSATKIILEIIIHEALKHVLGNYKSKSMEFIKEYEKSKVAIYREQEDISKLVEWGGETLKNGGHIYYIGIPPYGILGLIDASECPPTYGADYEDVRGFLDGGWDILLGKGKDLSLVGPLYRIGIDEFLLNKLPNLTKNDLVIVLGEGRLHELFKREYKTEKRLIGAKAYRQKPTYANLLQLVKHVGAKTGVVSIQSEPETRVLDQFNYLDCMVTPSIPGITYFKEFGMKLILNAITTGAHVRMGKVFQNRMIDLKISNNKLFYRTQHIISTIMNVEEEKARECMLKSIYETDVLRPEILNKSISDHIRTATPKKKVVPKAMLMATGKYNYKDAKAALTKDPIVRNIILRWVQKIN